MVEDHHCFVLHDVWRVLFDELLVPAAAEVWHEPEHVAPPGAVARRVRVAFHVAEVMVLAMVGHPGERRAFAGEAAEEGKQPAHRPISLEAAMREAAMVTHADAHRARDQDEDRTSDNALPTEV